MEFYKIFQYCYLSMKDDFTKPLYLLFRQNNTRNNNIWEHKQWIVLNLGWSTIKRIFSFIVCVWFFFFTTNFCRIEKFPSWIISKARKRFYLFAERKRKNIQSCYECEFDFVFFLFFIWSNNSWEGRQTCMYQLIDLQVLDGSAISICCSFKK